MTRVQLNDLQRRWLAEIGVDSVLLRHFAVPEPAAAPTPSARPALSARPAPTPARVQRAAAAEVEAPEAPAAPVPAPAPEDLPDTLEALHYHALRCERCELHRQRHQLVFGAGDTNAPEWMMVGEAPGQTDDGLGLPFQGKAGQLLHAMMLAVGHHAAGFQPGGDAVVTPPWSQPTSAYFTNVVKCRPLGNQSPSAAQIAACRPYLQAQIQHIKPQRILALGQLAAQSLLGAAGEQSVETLRGSVHTLTLAGLEEDVPVVVTWHPATLLLHPHLKPLAWQDIQLAARL